MNSQLPTVRSWKTATSSSAVEWSGLFLVASVEAADGRDGRPRRKEREKEHRFRDQVVLVVRGTSGSQPQQLRRGERERKREQVAGHEGGADESAPGPEGRHAHALRPEARCRPVHPRARDQRYGRDAGSVERRLVAAFDQAHVPVTFGRARSRRGR